MSIKFTQLKPTKLGLDSTLDFGCYFGYTVLEVLKDQPEYIRWLIKANKQFLPEVYQAYPEYTLVSKGYQRIYNDDYFSDMDDVPF